MNGLLTHQRDDTASKTLAKEVLKGYEQAINRLMKKVSEYQDLTLQEIKFRIRMEFRKRDSNGQKPLVLENVVNSLLDCFRLESEWTEQKLRGKERMYDYCNVKIDAFYLENYKGKIITFSIPELSFEYDK